MDKGSEIQSDRELDLMKLIKSKIKEEEDREIAVISTFAVHKAIEYDLGIVDKAIEIAGKDGVTMQEFVSRLFDILPKEINDFNE